MLIIGAAALIFFGPDQLPKVARRAGQVVRDVQNTSQSFIREMERAADEAEFRDHVAAAVTPPTKPGPEPHEPPPEPPHAAADAPPPPPI
jgi:Sec-independent protein translocase protein TatA